MSYLAYPPRLPVEFSESVAQLITLTLKIKHEVAPHKNEHNQSLTRWGRASIHRNKPIDAKSALLRRQVRRSRYWIAFAGEADWRGSADLSSKERLDLSGDLLRNLEGMFLMLQAGGICPLTKVMTLNRALAMRPVLSIRQLAEDAHVSESTAKRWLKSLESRGVLSSVLKDGQRQYINDGLVGIMEKYV
jgi:DNA-binding transcriptional ArsR family regulator